MIEFNNYAVGRVVRKIRKKQKLSQEVFSGFAQLARSHLAMIENGSKQANFETVWRIAAAFDMHPYELVRLIEEEAEALLIIEQIRSASAASNPQQIRKSRARPKSKKAHPKLFGCALLIKFNKETPIAPAAAPLWRAVRLFL